METLQSKIIVSISRALLGEVFPALRGVAFSETENSIKIYFYVDAALDEEDQESISAIETEVMADFFPEYSVEAIATQLENSKRCPKEGIFVFRRKEEGE